MAHYTQTAVPVLLLIQICHWSLVSHTYASWPNSVQLDKSEYRVVWQLSTLTLC